MRQVIAIPKDAEKLSHRILAVNATTGKPYELSEGLLYQKGNALYFEVPMSSKAVVSHEGEQEEFKKGIYEVVRHWGYKGQKI